MAIRTELSLRLPNSPGALASVCRALADEQVTVLALALDGGVLRLVVDNHVRAEAALTERRRQVSRRDVLFVLASRAPGSLAGVLELAAGAGVNVDYAYSAATPGSESCVVVLGVDDPMRAAAASGL